MAIWDRQQGDDGQVEAMRWYSRFVVYREMGFDRSLLGAYKLHLSMTKGEEGRVRQPIRAPETWSRQADLWQWKVRAEAWDMENLRRKEQEWAERRRLVQEADFTDGQKLRDLVKEFIELFPQFHETQHEEKTLPDGSVEIVITQRVNATLKDMATALKTASDLQRVTTGLETEHKKTELSGTVGVEHEGEVSVVKRTPWDQLEEALDRAVGEVEMAEAAALNAEAIQGNETEDDLEDEPPDTD